MAWTTPKTWVAGNTLTAAELNEQVRDNLDFLYAKPGAVYNVDEAANYTTTSTTFVDVDGTNLSLTITTGGGDVLIWFAGNVRTSTSTSEYYFDIDVDGSRIGGDDGIIVDHSYQNQPSNASFVYLATGLSAGSHTFTLQWRCNTANYAITMYAGAGTSNLDVHPQFGVREL